MPSSAVFELHTAEPQPPDAQLCSQGRSWPRPRDSERIIYDGLDLFKIHRVTTEPQVEEVSAHEPSSHRLGCQVWPFRGQKTNLAYFKNWLTSKF